MIEGRGVREKEGEFISQDVLEFSCGVGPDEKFPPIVVRTMLNRVYRERHGRGDAVSQDSSSHHHSNRFPPVTVPQIGPKVPKPFATLPQDRFERPAMMMTTDDYERLRSLITACGYASVLEAVADLIDQAAGNLPEGLKRKLFLGAGKVRAAASNVSEALP